MFIFIGAVLLVPAVLLGALWLLWSRSNIPSKIVDFRPTTFEAKAATGFFYSVGNQLKFGDEISVLSPTLAVMPGKVAYFLVSPDSGKIAAVASGKLFVVIRTPLTIRQVVSVDSIFREQKPLGRQFFRDFEMQWSRDSKTLYLIKDEFYETKGAQLFSDKAELWRYDVNTQQLAMVLKPFPAGDFFLGQTGIYFSAATPSGDLQLKYFDSEHTRDVIASDGADISVGQLNPKLHESPFSSFDSIRWRNSGHYVPRQLSIVIDEANGLEKLEVGNSAYLVFTRGEGLKGSYYCDQAQQGDSLPGDRYFVFSTYCDNFEGEMLLDMDTGKYERLPKDSRVFLTFNTESYPHYRITISGIEAE
jgi:hypothetical protein